MHAERLSVEHGYQINIHLKHGLETTVEEEKANHKLLG